MATFSQTCHVRTAAEPQYDPSFCTPNDHATATLFHGFKKAVNQAATQMAVPYSVDTANPNLDEDTFRLLILIAQALSEHLQQTQRAEMPALMRMVARAQAGQSPDQFNILASNTESLMVIVQAVANGEYGRRVAMTPTAMRVRRVPPNALLALVGFGLLGATVIAFLTPTATKGATWPSTWTS